MPVLPLVVGLILTAAEPGRSPSAAAAGQARVGYRPSGSAVDLHDLRRLARLRDPGITPIAAGPHDGAGGSLVLAEVSGPGILQRIRIGRPDLRSERLRIHVDGRSRPVLDVLIADLFAGKHPRFPRPLVGEDTDGFVCFVPIPFRDGCKVVIDRPAARCSRINLISLPTADGIASFAETMSKEERGHLDRAVRLWSEPEETGNLGLTDAEPAVYRVDALGRSSLTYALPDGPKTIRSFEVEPTAETTDAWRSARLRLVWDGDEAAPAGVDLPLGLAFGQVQGAAPYRSILTGQIREGGAWSLRFPMPYRRRATLKLDSERPIQGKIRLLTESGVDPDAGYFHAHSTEARPAQPKGDLPLLDDRGRGHLVGLFLATEGRARLSPWLEAADRFEVDGKLVAQGPGLKNDGRCGVFTRPGTAPCHGFLGFGKASDGRGFRAATYRWFLADPLPYSRSVVAGLVQDQANAFEANSQAATFWYSDRPGTAPRPGGSKPAR